MAQKKEEKQKDRGFEESMERLETLVKEMEEGTLSLEDMIARFEEGQSLIKVCTRKLNEVERKIEVLVKKGQALATEPFEEGGDGAEPDLEEES
jgi:exodeoxyribonuclease VII small subunit